MLAEKMKLTLAEKIFVWRRRLGLSQNQAAKLLGVSRSEYCSYELALSEKTPDKRIGEITPVEACILLRRRQKKTQRQIAQEIGICKAWVTNMEKGTAPSKKLLEYWGFK